MRFLFIIALFVAALAATSYANNPDTVRNAVAVCDPNAPANCVVPGSGGGTKPLQVTPTDKGGTMTLGGAAQNLAPSNTSRVSIEIQNPCTATGQGIATAEDLFISVAGSATVNGSGNYADLAACGSTTITVDGQVYTGSISVNAATTGHRWIATEWQ